MAKPGRIDEVRLLGIMRRRRSELLVGTALQAATLMVLSLPAAAQPAPNARPLGGTVVAGAASISQNTTSTTINQSSQRAAVNWQSFDVGSQQAVTFNQPSASAMTLNRVTGPNPSQIAGRIDANGQVVLVNQSGVTFYKGSQVNTNGLIVTAVGITNQNFMNGVMQFDQPGDPNARVENQGTITVKQAGLAALVAPQVANSGVINAKLGHVVLAGAKTATLDLYGDGLLSLDVTNQVTQTPVGPDGNAVTALVTNTGVIRADGGTVQLTARAADGLVQTLVQAGGTIRAATAVDQTGTVALGGVGGSIIVEGQLSAPGRAPGTTGGNIEIASTGNVVVAPIARINASGKAGGGVVAIGTTLARARGGPSVTPAVTAANTVIAPGALIRADATAKGDGGTVTVLATSATAMAGRITAKGGPQGGNGGAVEVSGSEVSLTGQVDTSAPLGAIGRLMLDPSDLWVSDTQPSNFTTFHIPDVALPTVGAGQAPDAVTVSWVTPTQLQSQYADISLATTNNLFVASSFQTPNMLDIGSHTLTLTAGNNLTIDRGFSITAAGISLTASAGAITLGGSSGVTGGMITTPQLAALTPTSLQASTATTAITMNAGFGIALADAVLGSSAAPVQTLDLSAGSSAAITMPLVAITQSPASVIYATTLRSTSDNSGDVFLLGTANAIANLEKFAVNSGYIGCYPVGCYSFYLADSVGLVVRGAVSADLDVYLKSPTISIAATGSVGAGLRASFQTDAFAIVTGGAVTGGIFELAPNTSGGKLTLGAPTPNLALANLSGIGPTTVVLGAVSAPGSTHSPTTTAGSINIAGAFGAAGTSIELDASGRISENGGILTAPNLTGSGGAWALTNPNNAITSLYNVTATSGDLVIVSSNNLRLAGSFNANNMFIEVAKSGGTLTLGGILPAAPPLEGSSPPVPVMLTSGTNGRISLVADSMSVAMTVPNSSITAPAGTVELAPLSSIDTSIRNGSGLVVGPLLPIIQTGGGTLVVGGYTNVLVNPNVPTITAKSISIDSPVELTTGIASTLQLEATAGGMTEVGGTLAVANLTGNSGGFVGLSGVNNITALGANAGSPFSAAGQSFTLLDSGASSLTVNGVTGATVALTAPSINIPGAITGTTSVNLVATAAGGISESGSIATPLLIGNSAGSVSLNGVNNITALGANAGSPFNAVGQSFTLLDSGASSLTVNGVTGATVALTAPSINIPGAITGTTSVNLVATAAGGISETVATGVVTTPLLLGSSLLGDVGLLGTNAVDALSRTYASSFDATGRAFALNTVKALTVNGVKGAALALSAPSLSIPGTIAGTTGVILVATTAGGISESGSITTPLLSGSSAGTVGLTGTNTIAALGISPIAPFNAVGQTFTLLDAAAPALTGLMVNGVSAAAVNLKAPTISISGAITGTTGVALNATNGGIIEGGSISTALLTGSASTNAGLTGANKVSGLGDFTASTGFTLNNGVDLAISGTVNGGLAANVNLPGTLVVTGMLTANTVNVVANGSIVILGTVADANSVNLFTGGSINETGVLLADLLTGNAGGNVNLTGANQVIQLGNFTAGGSFTLNDNINLTIGGVLTAPKITINDGSNLLTLANGASVATSGNIRPAGAFPASLAPGGATGTTPNAAPGALFQAGAFNQVGSDLIGGGPSTLQIKVTGNIQFGGLQAPNTWLILNVNGGKINGNVFVAALDVLYADPAASSQLSGSIGGLTGAAAASVGNVHPVPNSNLFFNSCVIQSACGIQLFQLVPTANPVLSVEVSSLFKARVGNINVGTLGNSDEQDDLLLPGISDKDF